MSALSSRVFTRPTVEIEDYDLEDSGGGGAAEKAERVKIIPDRRIQRTSSSERVLSRVFTRPTVEIADYDFEDSGGGGAAEKAERVKIYQERRIRRSSSWEDVVPPAFRMTADRL